jgi:cytoskeletal protein RodZ
MVEAMEKEQWDTLPSAVFVKGFLRSYAKLLGIDEEELISLYEKEAPKQPRPFKPVLRKSQSRKSGTFVIAFFIVVAMALAFWWIQQPPRRAPFSKPELTAKSQGKKPLSAKAQVSEKPAPAPGHKQTLGGSKGPQIAPTREVKEVPLKPAAPAPEPEKAITVSPPRPTLVLKGNVKERTWMRVSVDGGDPKEYIFEPGSRPQWKGERLFDIMVGNAGGIELELNGKPLGTLGKRGKVVHLILPQKEERWSAEG